ncbi:hypothetical protein BV898_19168 [Hypsibius exemplaris]|uniref:BTB domain-containing protein n=1 Tax=Hypsibius exemplaris TaxID=2072580 RepID=A0A9X6NL54_HYPEX|nr:hypothetical protein BV898_19168 [Hypsibius exemplaris]
MSVSPSSTPRSARFSASHNPFGVIEPGCNVPKKFPKTFHDVKLYAVASASARTTAETAPANETASVPEERVQQPVTNGHLRGCRYMADDIIIKLFEEEKWKERRALDEENERKTKEEEDRRRNVGRGKVKGRFKNALVATRMNRFLNQNTEANEAKIAAKSALNADGTSRLPRPFEDPLIRLQRQMLNENKDHFVLLHKRLLDLWFHKTLCDVILKTCDEAFHVHSCLLATHCGFWRDFCDDRHYDLCQHIPVEIDFRNKVTGIGLKTVIHFLYTGRIKVSHENCVEVFDAARALKMRDLSHLCERFIKVLLQDHNLWSTVSATRNTASAIFDIAWTKLATRFVRLAKTEAFSNLELQDLLWFLSSDELLVTVFQAALLWITSDRSRRLSDFPAVMGTVRFAYMTTDELVQCMNSDPIFQEEMGIEILSQANLAKVFANENQQWSDYDLFAARRPELDKNLKKFLNPDTRALLEDELKIKQLDAQVSTNSLDLGKLFDRKYVERHHNHPHHAASLGGAGGPSPLAST